MGLLPVLALVSSLDSHRVFFKKEFIMADYSQVPRALSRLAETARQVIPLRAQAEERRARIGLAQARTEFDIGEAKATRTHRERVFEAGEKARGEAREHRAWEKELKEPILRAAGGEARRKLEKLEYGEKPTSFGDLFGGLTAEDMPHVVGDLLPAYEKGLGIKVSKDVKTNRLSVTKDGQPYKRWQLEEDADLIQRITMYNTDAKRLMETWADPMHKEHPWHEKAKKILKDNDEEAIQRLGLKILRKFPPGKGASAAVVAQYNSQIKWTQDQVKHYQDLKVKGKTGKFVYWDSTGKKHTQFIDKREFPAAEKTVRQRGGSMEKPDKETKPTAANISSVLKLVDKFTAKGANEPTAEQATAINDAAQQFGYEYKKVMGPIRKQDKRFYWWDPDKKAYWTVRPKTTKQALMRGLPEGPTAPPTGMLKEGVRTTFKNGQVWTLKNGTPTLIGETGVGRRKIKGQSIGQKEMKEIDKAGISIPFTPVR